MIPQILTLSLQNFWHPSWLLVKLDIEAVCHCNCEYLSSMQHAGFTCVTYFVIDIFSYALLKMSKYILDLIMILFVYDFVCVYNSIFFLFAMKLGHTFR